MPQAKSSRKHNPDHYIAIRKLRHTISLVFLYIAVASIAALIKGLFFYKGPIDNPTRYDYVTGLVILLAAGMTILVETKFKSEDVKQYVSANAGVWFVGFALFLGYFKGRNDFDSWKSLVLVNLGGMAYLLFAISRHMDGPGEGVVDDDPDPEGIL
jgi:peptidoglycan/LPS O-acetylase OafA/YrhL